MAITILKQPKTIVWSKNPVVFEFSTNNRYSQVGSIYIGEMNFTQGVATEDYTFTLTWKGLSYVFTFKEEPNDSGLQLPTILPDINLAEWKRAIADALSSFYLLYEDFDIRYENGKIKIISRTMQQSMNLTLSEYSAGVEISLNSIQAASDQIARDNFAIFMEICFQNEAGQYESFTRSVIEIDGENKAIWDIQEYLTAGLLQHSEPRPDFGLNKVWKENISARNFFLRFAEMYGYPQQMKALETSDYFTALLGGVDLDHVESYALPDYLKDDVVNKWVTGSEKKSIHSNQKDYACIVNLNEDIQDVKLHIDLYYPDQKLVKESLNIGAWDKNQKLHIPIGVDELSALLNKDIAVPNSICLTLRKGDSLISNSIEYIIINKHYPFAKTLMFLNSLGCFESLYTYGRSELSYSIDKNEKAFEQKIERHMSEGSIKEIDIQLRDEIKINSGYRSKEDIMKFRDFILSKSKFILHNGTFKPVILESNSINEFQDGNYLYAISFTIKFSNEQILYSN